MADQRSNSATSEFWKAGEDTNEEFKRTQTVNTVMGGVGSFNGSDGFGSQWNGGSRRETQFGKESNYQHFDDEDSGDDFGIHKQFNENGSSDGSEQDVKFQRGATDGVFDTEQIDSRDSLKYIDPKSRGESISMMKSLSVVQEPNPQRIDFLHKGIMLKQSPALLKVWQKRYFVLNLKTLKYYKNESDYLNKLKPKGTINFNQISAEYAVKDTQLKIDLKIKGETRVFQFKCLNKKDHQEWKDALFYTISQSHGKKVSLSKKDNEQLNNKKKFWRLLWIDEHDFENVAETGDFILCSNNQGPGDVAKYERIHLLFKMEDKYDNTQKGLFVLSPGTTEMDIIMGTWEQFKEFSNNRYTDISFRPLECVRNELFLRNADKFISELQSQPYYQDSGSQSFISDISNEKRPYTNIEIAIKFLRNTNLLNSSNDNNIGEKEQRLQPKDFSQGQSQKLVTNGQELFGEEQYILLTKNQQYMNTLTNQDIIENLYEKLEEKKKSSSVAEPDFSLRSTGTKMYIPPQKKDLQDDIDFGLIQNGFESQVTSMEKGTIKLTDKEKDNFINNAKV